MNITHYLFILAAALAGIIVLKIVKALLFRILLLIAVAAFILYLLM